MKSKARIVTLLSTLSLSLLLSACPEMPDLRAPGTPIDCPSGEQRVVLDCSGEIRYQGADGEVALDVMGFVGAEGKMEEKALRQVNENVEQFVASHKRACRDYNACIGTEADYRGKASEIEDRMARMQSLQLVLKNATTDEARMAALDKLWSDTVPAGARSGEVAVKLAMVAELPPNLGGQTFSLPEGGKVPTEARMWFQIETSETAHVYMFQVTPSRGLHVLFPDARIGTRNPLSGGVPSRIPGEKKFRVNEDDVGTEKVYVVVSRQPISDLNSALDKVKSGAVENLGQSDFLQALATVEPPSNSSGCNTRALELDEGGAPSGCSRSRGLELDDEPGQSTTGGLPAAALAVKTEPADDTIVTVVRFNHLTQEAYKAETDDGAAPASTRSRGILIED